MSNLDWQHWFEHWETMLNCYVPQRPYRFDLMLRLADLPREDQVQILDLGCGPGSLGFRALRRYPNAHVVAVDSDPVLLSMGQAIGQETASRIQFVQADIQQPDWWAPYDETFDLVLSATALRLVYELGPHGKRRSKHPGLLSRDAAREPTIRVPHHWRLRLEWLLAEFGSRVKATEPVSAAKRRGPKL